MGGVSVAVPVQAGVGLGVGAVEDRQGRTGDHAQAGRPHLLGDGVRSRLRLGDVLRGEVTGGAEVRLEARDGVATPPRLQLGLVPVPGGVVRGGVRTHPICHGLDVGRALPGARVVQRPAHRRQAGEDVVPVHAEARDPEPGRAPGDRILRLHGDRLGDGPVVVLTDEDDRRLIRRGEDHRLVHIPLAGRPVTEVGHGDLRRLLVLDAERVPDRVQGLGADDDLQRSDPGGGGTVGGPLFTAPHPHVVPRLRAARVDHAGLPVAREDVVLRIERPGRTDLRGFLALARRPEPQLPLALQGHALGIDAAEDDHVAVQGPQLSCVDIGDERVEAVAGDTGPVRSEDALRQLQILGGVRNGGGLRRHHRPPRPWRPSWGDAQWCRRHHRHGLRVRPVNTSLKQLNAD